MNESVLHHVWQHRLFKQFALQTCSGETVEVIDAGRLNRDAGPDFFNAKIKIGGTIWVGNVEIHIRSSDWYKHNHHLNTAYDNVVLHVVGIYDGEVYTTKGGCIPQLLLAFSPETAQKIETFLLEDISVLQCKTELCRIESVFLNDWKQVLLIERLEKKCRDVRSTDESFVDPDEILYRLIFRSFGTHLNADVFLMMAVNLPLRIVKKHLNEPRSMLALLAGLAGFINRLPVDIRDDMMREYIFLKRKYGLTEINAARWRELRTRPHNFPFNRLMQLVVFLPSFFELRKSIVAGEDFKDITKTIMNAGNRFADDPDFKVIKSIKRLTPDFANHLLINAIIPYYYYQHSSRSDSETFEKIIECLQNIFPERNAIITVWKSAGMEINNAFDSQTLIHLMQHYCKEKKCLRCRIGHQVLKKIIELPEIIPV